MLKLKASIQFFIIEERYLFYDVSFDGCNTNLKSLVYDTRGSSNRVFTKNALEYENDMRRVIIHNLLLWIAWIGWFYDFT
uniref:Uncharacterized protein n=1 Tax=Pararge aegeria TaxID=116150 RepID=S4P760_9NEOP